MTVDLKSKEAVDLYVIVDGRIGFVRKEELPLTMTVGSAQLVGIRSQLRDTSLKKYGDYTATLSVQLSDKEPESKKKKNKRPPSKKGFLSRQWERKLESFYCSRCLWAV